MPLYLYAVSLVGSLGVGWLAGMWTRRRSDTWCSDCGSTLACPACARSSADHVSAERV